MSKTSLKGTFSNSFAIGAATNVDGYVYFDNGQTNKPGIKYNSRTSKIQGSNDGSTWNDISTGTSSHNSLTGLQGGKSGSSEYYHLGQDSYTWVNDAYNLGYWSALKGGTGLRTYTSGDILYSSATNTLAKLPKSTDGYYLKLASGLPSWAEIIPFSLPSANIYQHLEYSGTSWEPVDNITLPEGQEGEIQITLATPTGSPTDLTICTPFNSGVENSGSISIYTGEAGDEGGYAGNLSIICSKSYSEGTTDTDNGVTYNGAIEIIAGEQAALNSIAGSVYIQSGIASGLNSKGGNLYLKPGPASEQKDLGKLLICAADLYGQPAYTNKYYPIYVRTDNIDGYYPGIRYNNVSDIWEIKNDGYTENQWFSIGTGTNSTPTTSSVDLFNVGGRLTFVTATPYLTSALGYAAGNTLYWTPIKGGSIALYKTSWNMYTPGELSIGIAGLAGEKLYDVFMYLNGNTPTLSFGTAWSNDAVRDSKLAAKDNIYVKNGNDGYRYLGTVRTFGSGPITFEFSRKTISLWNYYNRVKIPARVLPTDDYWALSSSTTWRPFNNSSSNVIGILIGIKEDIASIKCQGLAANWTDDVCGFSVGIGINSSSVNSAQLFGGGSGVTAKTPVYASYEEYLEPGFNYIYALESNWYGGNVNMFGDNGDTNIQTGLIGSLYG